ncbi:DUF4124 domain-containing protein [Chitinimonas sp. BJB300]|uniref:DUF4124 domain-containing protein n=1 Tax=Chitinimonas sp. BJB300 TaxID=1559339 RepID=UPI000C10828C|nr:DUF4124 domain-containing protein [Chitinimonas sp. BJB300]PHV10368.1 DUF4124 domain-containing protein [Chitinimonas sp. BJB300]TSJ91036.1 DUF4124 domain-containing protein [Chitinimonas sp. BJB300]
MLLRPLLITCFVLPAVADIYKHVDKDGQVTYSNIPIKGAKRMELDPLPPNSVPAPRSGQSRAANNPTPGNFPRVDSATQKNRDEGRRQILQDEMASEQKLLTESRQRLTAAPQDAKLRDKTLFHEKNIETLQKEIARVQ